MIILLKPRQDSHSIDHILSTISKKDLAKAIKQGQIHQDEIAKTFSNDQEKKAATAAKRPGVIICNPYWSQTYGG